MWSESMDKNPGSTALAYRWEGDLQDGAIVEPRSLGGGKVFKK